MRDKDKVREILVIFVRLGAIHFYKEYKNIFLTPHYMLSFDGKGNITGAIKR